LPAKTTGNRRPPGSGRYPSLSLAFVLGNRPAELLGDARFVESGEFPAEQVLGASLHHRTEPRTDVPDPPVAVDDHRATIKRIEKRVRRRQRIAAVH
jgi:hypothetical protein